MRLKGKVAIVTGAGTGLGRGIALMFGREGASVVVNGRRPGPIEATAKIITDAGGRAATVAGDVTVTADVKRLIRAAVDGFGQLDVLVNNAGIIVSRTNAAECTEEDWRKSIEGNLTSVFLCSKYALPELLKSRGNIINLSSNVTIRFPAGYGPYTVSKAGLEALTRILSKEEGPNGIRVNAIAPGPIQTEMLEQALAVMGPERAQSFINSVPLGRTGRPEEIASVVRFLVSEDASYITGQVIFVNGGGPGG